MLKQFDLISDIHLDFWMKTKNKTKEEQTKDLRAFVHQLLPEDISKVLVIAGDLGHQNAQNAQLLSLLKEHYEYILLVPGNHDYYLVNSSANYKYNRRSLLRWEEMKTLGQTLDGVYFLEGDMVTIDEVTFGGTGMWYDFSYGIQVLGKSVSQMLDIWQDGLNDGTYIHGPQTRPLQWYWSEQSRLEDVIDASDVIITHVGPDWSKMPEKYKMDPISGCYYFDGQDYLKRCQQKVWCFGHTHVKYSYTNNGCWLVNNALGYPGEENGNGKIVNIPLK